MKRIAHRGYRTLNIKENTMEAFLNACNNGFDGFEFDVRKTLDEKLVVCHNSWINLTSDGSGLISDMTYEELSKYNFGTEKVKSKIPLLEEVLKEYKDSGKIKLVELKTRVDLDEVLDLIDEDTYFISFDSTYINYLNDKYPDLKFGVLNYVLNSDLDYDLDIICLLDNIASDELVDYFLNRGVKVFIYGIVGKIDYKSDEVYYIVNNLSVE